MRRDLSIDLVRGAGVLMIAVDHLGGLLKLGTGAAITFPFVTWTRVGWSSAAEFFVFFSGYLVGLIYTQTLQKQGIALAYARAAHRSWQIYVANLLTLCAVLLLLRLPLLASPQLEAATALNLLTDENAIQGLMGFLTLQSAPAYFEILHLYIALLLVAPLLLLVARMSILVALACSVAVWACVQWNPQFNLASWNFNPFAWQLVFILGMLCSVGGVFEKLRNHFGRRTVLWVTGSFLLLALGVKIVDKAGWSVPLLGQIDVTGINRTSVGPLLLLHFLVSVVFVMQVVPQGDVIARSMFGRLVASVGQYSLECFCISTVLVYAASGWMIRTGTTGPVVVFGVGIAIIALVCLWALFMNWLKAQPWRGKSVTNAGEVGKEAAPGSLAPTGKLSPSTTPDAHSMTSPGIPREPA
jgi:hypothetical protein